MKKSFALHLNSILFVLFALLIVTPSCKKGDGDNGEGDGENTFTINGTVYKTTSISYIEELNTLKAQRITPTSGLNEVQTLSITFSDDEFPKTGGSFDVVSNPYSPSDKTNNNQVAIIVTTFPHMRGSLADDLAYHPEFSPVQHVMVTINGNKINVKFSDLKFQSETGESATISGNITLVVNN